MIIIISIANKVNLKHLLQTKLLLLFQFSNMPDLYFSSTHKKPESALILNCELMRSQSPYILLTGFNTNYIIVYLMPSRADDSFLLMTWCSWYTPKNLVSMPSRADDSFLRNSECAEMFCKAMCQCPLGLMTHFYIPGSKEHAKAVKFVSMPSRADDSFLRYPFKNLGFMRFPEPIFAGICQNILTDPLFRSKVQH